MAASGLTDPVRRGFDENPTKSVEYSLDLKDQCEPGARPSSRSDVLRCLIAGSRAWGRHAIAGNLKRIQVGAL